MILYCFYKDLEGSDVWWLELLSRAMMWSSSPSMIPSSPLITWYCCPQIRSKMFWFVVFDAYFMINRYAADLFIYRVAPWIDVDLDLTMIE